MKSRPKIEILWLSVMAVCLCACSSRALHDAQDVVAQADSLWLAGQSFEDITRMAAAYMTLGSLQYFYADEYAHACYHYGRLLRTKDNPVAAMQTFIDATHSHTSDYHILGRVYSNMGDICHKAAEYTLSYNMFECSSEMFLRNGDTLLHDFLLNDIAYELAEQGNEEETLFILDQISSNNIENPDIELKICETKAILYREINQYDSTIIYAQKVLSTDDLCTTMLLATAQAYYYLAQYDSALVYANKVIKSSDFYGDIYNALYIISHEDSTLTKEEVLQLTSQREDIRFEEYEPMRKQLTEAVLLLKSDITRKPDFRWLYTLLAVTLFVGSVLVLSYTWRKRKLHRQIIEEIEIRQNQIEALSQRQEEHRRQINEEIETICSNLRDSENWKKELCWNNYPEMCKIVNIRLYDFVTCLQPFCLSEKEVRLCVLILLKASTNEMANNVPYAKSGLGKFKLTTARKLGTTTREMRSFLLNLMN